MPKEVNLLQPGINMASLYTRKNSQFIWLKYYDKIAKEPFRTSTKFPTTKEGWRKAKELVKEVNAGIVLGYKMSESAVGPEKAKTIKEAYEHFKIHLSSRHKGTKNEYQRFYNRFIQFFPEALDCAKITKSEIGKFLIMINNLPKLQRNSKYVIYKNTKRFLNFLFDNDYLPFFKISKDFYIKPEIKDILVFTLADIKIILEALPAKNENFQIMIYLLLYTGLRPSDLINIRVEDIDFVDATLKYYSPKTDEHRVVPINQELIPLLKKRIDEVKIGRLLGYAQITNMGKAFQRFADDLKLNTDYNLRTFRKTFISLAHGAGMELATVSKLVGHKSILTTSKYYHKLSIARQNSEMNKLSLASLGTSDGHTKKKRKKKAS
jgi:integrase/recombinase XerD